MNYRSVLRAGTALVAAPLLALAVSGPAAAGPPPPGHVFKGTPSSLTPADVARLSANATQRSIIIFKDQLPSLPAAGSTAAGRVKAANAAQAGVLGELKQLHATHVTGFHVINAIAATISAAEATRLRGDSAVSAVVPDAMRTFAPLGSAAGPASSASARLGQASPADPVQQVCPSNPAQPLNKPQAGRG
jgi:hypothetical protein